MSPSGGLFRFGDHELDLATRSLRRRDGTRVPLQEKPFALLAVLVARAPHVVEREELARQLWGEGTFVDVDHGLNTAVRKLRDALGDDAHEPRFIETVARHGYRFA